MDTAASSGFGFQNVSSTDAYAIPIAKALAIAKQIEAGKASATVHIGATAFLGVEVQAVQTAGYGGGYGSTGATGSLVAGVVGGGPADKAGLVAGDVITAIDGRVVTTPTVITAVLQTKKPGTRVTLRIVDQTGSTHSVSVKLGSGPPQ
jgi:S1-C subfamily serine protease